MGDLLERERRTLGPAPFRLEPPSDILGLIPPGTRLTPSSVDVRRTLAFRPLDIEQSKSIPRPLPDRL